MPPQSNCLELQNQYRELQKLKAEFDLEYERALLSKKLDKAQALKTQLQQASRELKSKMPVTRISAVYKDAETGQETAINFELNEQLEYWRKFYQKHNIDWCELPESITVAPEQAAELQRLIENYGFDYMMIIPEGLADTGDKYEELYAAMTALSGDNSGYERESIQWDNFIADGGFKGLKNKRNGLRIVLTKAVKDLVDDALFNSTIDVSVDDLEAAGGLFEQKKVTGMNMAEYLIMQRDYYEKNINKKTKYEKHLDRGHDSWLTEHERPSFGRVPSVGWDNDDYCLWIDSGQSNEHVQRLGCRLAGSVEIAT